MPTFQQTFVWLLLAVAALGLARLANWRHGWTGIAILVAAMGIMAMGFDQGYEEGASAVRAQASDIDLRKCAYSVYGEPGEVLERQQLCLEEVVSGLVGLERVRSDRWVSMIGMLSFLMGLVAAGVGLERYKAQVASQSADVGLQGAHVGRPEQADPEQEERGRQAAEQGPVRGGKNPAGRPGEGE